MITTDIDQFNFIEIIKNGRALCLDYGSKRIGVAISDAMWKIASPVSLIENSKFFKDILTIFTQYKISIIVVGIPIALNGGLHGRQHTIVNEFCEKLHLFLLENKVSENILQYDERLSTAGASRYLVDVNFSKKKKNIDKLAACFILQGVLDRINYKLGNA